MSTDLVRPPSRQELEALTLPERIALEDAFGEAHQLIRSLNDAEITRLAEAGASQRAIAEAMGVALSTAQNRMSKLGLAAVRERPTVGQAVPQTGNPEEAEVVEGEVVNDPPVSRRPREGERPAHYLPDVVSDDAETNLRTQALHWYEQGRFLEELLEESTLEARSKDDREAIKREADEMIRIARRLKGAIKLGR